MSGFVTQKEVLLVGGNGAAGGLSDAWIWSGTDWTATASFGVRFDASLVDTGSVILLFGGADDTSERNDTEFWDGATWSAAAA